MNSIKLYSSFFMVAFFCLQVLGMKCNDRNPKFENKEEQQEEQKSLKKDVDKSKRLCAILYSAKDIIEPCVVEKFNEFFEKDGIDGDFDVNFCDHYYRYPLMNAVEFFSSNSDDGKMVIKKLLDLKANPTQKISDGSCEGQTAFHYVGGHKKIDFLSLLIDSIDESINVLNEKEETALHAFIVDPWLFDIISKSEKKSIILEGFIIFQRNKRLNPNLGSQASFPLAELIKSYGNVNLIGQFMKFQNIDFSRVTAYGNTVFHLVCMKTHKKSIFWLKDDFISNKSDLKNEENRLEVIKIFVENFLILEGESLTKENCNRLFLIDKGFVFKRDVLFVLLNARRMQNNKKIIIPKSIVWMIITFIAYQYFNDYDDLKRVLVMKNNVGETVIDIARENNDMAIVGYLEELM